MEWALVRAPSSEFRGVSGLWSLGLGFRILEFGRKGSVRVWSSGFRVLGLLGGSWDLVTRVILILTYSPS